MKLNKQIRKTILETKEQKEKILIEQSLIKKRIDMIVGNVKTIDDYNNLSEAKQLKLNFVILQELSFLQENSLINEQADFSSIIKDLFGGLFGSGVETIAEPVIGKILDGLGFKGKLKNFLISFITSKPSDLINAMKDCKLLTKLISESIVEGMVMSMMEEKGASGKGPSLIRNLIGGAMKSNSFIAQLESQLSTSVCGIFNGFTQNAKAIQDKLSSATK
jgi:hypothetical protein